MVESAAGTFPYKENMQRSLVMRAAAESGWLQHVTKGNSPRLWAELAFGAGLTVSGKPRNPGVFFIFLLIDVGFFFVNLAHKAQHEMEHEIEQKWGSTRPEYPWLRHSKAFPWEASKCNFFVSF